MNDADDLLDESGSGPLPEPDDLDADLSDTEMQDSALLEGLAHRKPVPSMEPNSRTGRDQSPELQDETGMGAVLKHAGLTRAPVLPALRQSAPLRTVLENLGPDLVAAQCSAINRFNRIADRAESEDNKVLELLATKASALYQHKLIELVVGRTVNVNASIKSQRDLPKLEKLTPEKRAQLEQLVNEMTDVVDAEVLND